MIALYFVLATALICFGLLSLRWECWTAPGRVITLFTLFYGLIVKPSFVALSLPSEALIEYAVLLPLTRDEYWFGSVALLGVYALFLGAMVFTSWFLKRQNTAKVIAVHQWPRFAPRLGVVWLMIGLLGAALFFLERPDLLTGANKNSLSSDELSSYNGNGTLRLLTSVLYVLPFLMLFNLAGGYRKKSSRWLLWASSMAWICFGFFSDQRGLILFSLISWLIAYNMLLGMVDRRMLAVLLLGAFGMVLVKSANRFVFSEDLSGLEILNEIISNYIGRNFVENGKTLITMQAIPVHLPYAWGASYLDAVLLLIPRSLMPSKITVNLDTVIGNTVFECSSFGACAVPPGLIAESYLNFGLVWVMLSALICGWATAWLDWKAARSSAIYSAFYPSLFVYFGISVLGSSISSFITQALMHALILWLSYRTMRVARRKATALSLSPSSSTHLTVP